MAVTLYLAAVCLASSCSLAPTPEKTDGGCSVPGLRLFGFLLICANSIQNTWRVALYLALSVWPPAHQLQLQRKNMAVALYLASVCLASCSLAPNLEKSRGGCSVPSCCLFGLLLLTSANSRENTWRLLCTWLLSVWPPAHWRQLQRKNLWPG